MAKIGRDQMNLRKVSGYAIAINVLQIGAALAVALLSIFLGADVFNGITEQVALSAMALVVIWGAILDIREAFSARRIGNEKSMVEEALSKLNELNTTLRAQRHDFMNHLQVVYSLMEMQSYPEAEGYIEKIYADIQKVNRTLKTSIPAVNALLASKLADCDERGIGTKLTVDSAWQDLTVPDWELCRVLGNLIDNALDALQDVESPMLSIAIGESIQHFFFKIANNGPMIPETIRERIFERNFTSKGSGHGLGLTITRDILLAHGGTLAVRSDEYETSFSGEIPKVRTA